MRFGVSAFAWTGAFTTRHLDLLPRAREMGYTGFEIAMFDPQDLPVAQLRRAFEETGLDCTVCAILPQGLNPISPERSVRERSRLHLATCIETAAELGAHLLGGPVYAPIGYLPPHRRTDGEWNRAVDAIQSLGDLLTRNEVVLSLEPVNRSETMFLRTAADAALFCDAVGHPGVGVTIDTFHANIEEKSIEAAIEMLGPRLRHMHLSENDRGLLGSGHVDFASIAAALRRSRYNGYLVVEGFGFSPDEPLAPGALLADPKVSPEQVASEGIAFLRKLVGH